MTIYNILIFKMGASCIKTFSNSPYVVLLMQGMLSIAEDVV